MSEEQAQTIIQLLTEIRDEIYRQGFAVCTDRFGQTTVRTEEMK